MYQSHSMGFAMNDAGYTNPDINTHKQDRHVKGTIDHQIAVNNNRNPSTFPNRKTAEKYILDAWNTGEPSGRKPNRKEKIYQNPVGEDAVGKPLYQVTVQSSITGKHGWPSGDGIPGEEPNP
jgi:hypothetical protein